MAQAVLCPHCQARILNDGRLAGRSVSCPHCHGQFLMPPLASRPHQAPAQIETSTVGTQASSAERGATTQPVGENPRSGSPVPTGSLRRRSTAIWVSMVVIAACALVMGVYALLTSTRDRSEVAITVVKAGESLAIGDAPKMDYPKFRPSVDTKAVFLCSDQGVLTAKLPVLVRQNGEESEPYMVFARPASETDPRKLAYLICCFSNNDSDVPAVVKYRGREQKCKMTEKQAFEEKCIRLGQLKSGDMILSRAKTTSYVGRPEDGGGIQFGRSMKTRKSLIYSEHILADCVTIEGVSE